VWGVERKETKISCDIGATLGADEGFEGQISLGINT